MADCSAVVVDDDDDDESEIVTKFLLDTCLLRQPNMHHAHAAFWCSGTGTIAVSRRLPADDVLVCTGVDDKVNRIPLITGSSAEFYIQPMLSCVGDVDIMFHRSDYIAIPEGYPPPTELPAEFDSRVEVYEIIDSEYPGYVYLLLSYSLTEDNDSGKYNAVQHDHCPYISCYTRYRAGLERHGPAVTNHDEKNAMSLDSVPCIRCLLWPSQAADWPTRHRHYDWPDAAIVDRVFSNGCDVVHVAHRQCAQDEWTGKLQCRLSFSRAEIVLLNSWMPVQQIVYHMLRFFVKTKQITYVTYITGTKIFSNYHFKTLTLWACEMKSQRWWSDDMNVVGICVKLLHIFSGWLENKFCPHYFINSCNLIDNTAHLEIISDHLASITEKCLSAWFVNNYLRKCAQLCPGRVSRLFGDVSTSSKLQNAVSAVVDCRLNRAVLDLLAVCFTAECYILHTVSTKSLTVWSCGCWINELEKINSCLCDYFTAITFLHVTNRIAKRSFSDELLDVLATIIGQSVSKRRYCNQLSSESSRHLDESRSK